MGGGGWGPRTPRPRRRADRLLPRVDPPSPRRRELGTLGRSGRVLPRRRDPVSAPSTRRDPGGDPAPAARGWLALGVPEAAAARLIRFPGTRGRRGAQTDGRRRRAGAAGVGGSW